MSAYLSLAPILVCLISATSQPFESMIGDAESNQANNDSTQKWLNRAVAMVADDDDNASLDFSDTCRWSRNRFYPGWKCHDWLAIAG